MIKRMTMKFSEATHADLIWLSNHLQAGNMTATIAELVHAEVRRIKGLSGDPLWGNGMDPKEFTQNPTERQAITLSATGPVMEAMAPLAPLAPQEPPPEPELDLDPFKDLEPVEAPKQSRFKVFDPLDPVGSKPKYSEDQAGAILWTKEKKEYEDSQKVVLTGARVG